jgi:hypothetical protein
LNSLARTDVYDDDTTLALTMLYQRALDQLDGNEERLGPQSHMASELPGVESRNSPMIETIDIATYGTTNLRWAQPT